jgi:hypothetical protein
MAMSLAQGILDVAKAGFRRVQAADKWQGREDKRNGRSAWAWAGAAGRQNTW